MVNHICDICSKIFTQKGHFDKHKARKRPCVKNDIIEKLVEQKVQEVLSKTNIVSNPAVNEPVKSDPIEVTKPFMKWVGGKTQIIDEVIQLFPKTINNYHEPFVGGGSVLLALLSHKANGSIKVSGKIYASDLNSNLIGLYKNIQAHPDALLKEVKRLRDEFNKCEDKEINRKPASIEEAMTSRESYYFWIRAKFNALSKEERTLVGGSAMLLFMNKTCFRGVYRESKNGGFNVPYGNNKNPSIIDDDHIKKVSNLIKDVVFTNCSFGDALTKIAAGDFVYLDPPYAPENATSFVGYTADGFSLETHNLLFKLCGVMAAKNVKLLMSNAEVKLVKDAFPKPAYTTKIISCRRAIHSKEPGGRANEVLIMN